MSELTRFADRLCQTLLHSLWQGIAIVILVSIFVRIMQKRAGIGYAAWMSGIVAAVVCMPVTFMLVSSEKTKSPPRVSEFTQNFRASPGKTLTTLTSPLPQVAIPVEQDLFSKPAVQDDSAPTVDSQVGPGSSEQHVNMPPSNQSGIAQWIAAVYSVGVVLMLLRLCLAAINVDNLIQSAFIQKGDRLDHIVQAIATRWNMRISPVVAVTQRVVVPHVVGLIRPVILLPASAITGLSADGLMLVLTHEIAHLRRFDLWAAMMQRFAESILFFNPAVWYLSRRASEYREFCCDELVCVQDAKDQTNIHIRYAEALLQVVSLSAAGRFDSPTLTSLAVGGRSPSELRLRIARVLNEPLPERFPGGRRLLVAIGAGLLCLALPMLLPSDRTKGANNSAILAVDQPADQVDRRQFQLQVHGPDGKPVPNIECEIRGIPMISPTDVLVGKHIKNGSYGTFLLTNESGQLHFQRPAKAGGMDIFVRTPGYSPFLAAWRMADGSDGIPDAYTIELEAAWTVTGRVINEAGNAIANAEVSPSMEFRKRAGDDHQMGSGMRLTTDANGLWRCELVPESQADIHVTINHPDYSPNRMRLSRREFEAKPDTAPKTIVLTKGLTVTGTVTDEDGNPIADALIRTKYSNEIREARTDQEGNYLLRGCEPKLSRIVCSAKGRARELQQVLIDPSMAPVDFTMIPGRHVRIRVLDENGKGVARSRIFFQRWRDGHIDYFEFEGVPEYTDDQGVWEWDEAPSDEFAADICRKNGMMLRIQPILARDEEYVFRPPRLLVVSGRVTDQATGEPIKNFRCVPGGRDEPQQRPGETWHLEESYKSRDGAYKITRDSAVPAHLIRIEADGYKVAVSRDIQNEEGDVELNFELTQAPDISIRIETPDNQPAAEANVAVGLANEQIVIKNGEFTTQTYATRLMTDKTGVLKMPLREQLFEIFVLHPTGFAQISSANGQVPDHVTLTAWAAVKGTISSGNKPAGNVPVTAYSNGNLDNQLCRVSCHCEALSDENGAFHMPQVFPGTGRIGRDITYMVRDGATEVTSSQKLTATFAEGETTTIDIGRGGRPVIGKLVPPPEFGGQIVWGTLRMELEPDLPQPIPLGLNVNDPQAIVKWQQTQAAREYKLEMAAWKTRKAQFPMFHASVDRDGTFRIDNVSSGWFVLSQWLGLRDLKLTMPSQSFEIPQLDGDYDDTPFDLGEIHLKQL